MGRGVALAIGVACAISLAAACSSSSGNSAVAPDASTDTAAPPAIPPPSSTDPKVLAGYTAVLTRGCATCHEPPDASQGVLSGQDTPVAGTTAYGSNLTPDPDTGMDAWSASDIANALRMGVDNQGNPLCPAMPTYPTMGDTEADDIAAYLQQLIAVHHLVQESVCPPIKPTGDDGGLDAEAGDDGGLDGEAGDDGGDGASPDGDDGSASPDGDDGG